MIALIWISSLIVLIFALTAILQNNPFKQYQSIIGIGFISITGLLGSLYRRVINSN
jgi:hypothetical protein